MTDGLSRPDPEALLEHSGWVRALARSLVADPAAADDVEQEAWRRVLESPPRHGGNLKAWLGRVVRSAAAQRGRTEGRVARRHERSARPEEVPRPDEIAERMETFRALAAAVAELGEPHGSAVYLRYVEELPVAEVAARQGVPVPTAQTRIRRGVELLRERMRLRFGADWRNRCLVFAPAASSAAVSPFLLGTLAMTTKTKLLTGAAALLLLVPLTWVLLGESDADPPAERAPADPGFVAAVAPSDDPVTPSAASSEAGRTETASAAAGAPDWLDDPRAIHVTVRDAATLKPVRGAEVLWFDRADERDEAWTHDQFENRVGMETLLERYGQLVTTGENGVAVLPPRESFLYLGARDEHRFAFEYLLELPAISGKTRFELLLRPRVTVPVRVLDAAGEPVADQIVAYQTVYEPDRAHEKASVRTGPDGRAVFENFQVELADAAAHHEHRLAARIPGTSFPVHGFSPEDPPAAEVVLRLPPTGSLRVRLETSEGELARESHFLQVRALRQDEVLDDGPRWRYANAAMGEVGVRTDDGIAEIARVGLGERLLVSEYAGARVVGDGPTQAGETVEIVLTVHELNASRVPVRVVDPSGAPLAEVAVDAVQGWLAGEQELDTRNVRYGTNEKGGFHLQQRAPRHAEADLFRCRLMHAREGELLLGALEWHRDELDDPARGGDVVLGSELIASGQFVDAHGEPVPFVEMHMGFELPWQSAVTDAMERNHQELPSASARVVTGADGRFSIRGDGGEARDPFEIALRIPNGRGGFRVSSTELRVGVAEQRIVLQGFALVSGRLLLPDGVPERSLRLMLEHVDPAGAEESFVCRIDGKTGGFQRGDVPTGTATLVLHDSLARELVRSAPFAVAPGTDVTPTGWDPLDLRDRLQVHRIRVEGAQGEALPWASIHLPEVGRSMSGRTPVLLVCEEAQPLIVAGADEHRPSEAQLVSGAHTFRLERGLPVRFVLPEGVTLDGLDWWALHWRTSEKRAAPTTSGRLGPELGPDGRVHFTGVLPTSGRYQLALARLIESSRETVWASWEDGTRYRLVDIAEQPGEQRFSLPVTQVTVDAVGPQE